MGASLVLFSIIFRIWLGLFSFQCEEEMEDYQDVARTKPKKFGPLHQGLNRELEYHPPQGV